MFPAIPRDTFNHLEKTWLFVCAVLFLWSMIAATFQERWAEWGALFGDAFGVALVPIVPLAASQVFWPSARARAATGRRVTAPTGPRVFVNYRVSDARAGARQLADGLACRGVPVFIDTEGIGPGEEWPKRLEAALREADVLVCVIGPGWASPRLHAPVDWVRREIESALRAGLCVIPVLVDGADMPGRDDLPECLVALRDRQAFKLDDESWSRDVDRLVRIIRLRNEKRPRSR